MSAEADDVLAAWVGRHTETVEPLPRGSVAGLLALLDRTPDAAAAIAAAPPFAHWLVAPQRVPQSRLGPDGHALRGELLPPVELPRRMWAAASTQWFAPVPIDMPLQRRSSIASVQRKQGRSGALVFVSLVHDWRDSDGRQLVAESQQIVYREAQAAASVAPPAPDDDALHWPLRRDIEPDATLLFRYSALTFNAHRIHYDLPYARDVEGYHGLVVQGPLIATLLADLCERDAGPGRLASFAFQARAPAFAGRTLRLRARIEGLTVGLRALDDRGCALMTAEATLRDSR